MERAGGANLGVDEPSMKAELVPENGDPPIPITRDVVVVGRRGYCDVVIDHSSLSKRHCVLVKTDGLLVVRDLISTNGTKVKGQKVRWAALLARRPDHVGQLQASGLSGTRRRPWPFRALSGTTAPRWVVHQATATSRRRARPGAKAPPRHGRPPRRSGFRVSRPLRPRVRR